MTDKHTPGPWAVRFEGSRGQEIIVRSTVEIDDPFDGGKIEPLVADLFRGGPGNIADARLIAAAPELLKALQAAQHIDDIHRRMHRIEQRRPRGSFGIAVADDEDAVEWRKLTDEAAVLISRRNSAIAKATGAGCDPS